MLVLFIYLSVAKRGKYYLSMKSKIFDYLCISDGFRQLFITNSVFKFSDLASRLKPVEAFFIYGSSHVLPIPKQIIRVKSNILKSNIHKPKSACYDQTVSTGDKEVRQDRLYTLRDK